MERVKEMTAKGTGAIEIKSGYGLTLEDELKMLRVIRRIKETTSVMIKATFLGAHAIGRGYSHEAYVDLVLPWHQRNLPNTWTCSAKKDFSRSRMLTG